MKTNKEPKAETLDTVFGKRFAEARKSVKLSQDTVVAELSKRGYDLPLTAIGKIERGDRRVTVGEAAALADSLGFTLDALVNQQGAFLTAWAIVGRERDAHAKQTRQYLEALIDLVVIADSGESHLRDGDIEGLSKWVRNQTPTQSTVDSLVILQARISRENLDTDGQFMKLLVQAVQLEDDALVSLREDSRGR